MELLSLDVQREVTGWIDKAAKDLACLEEHGPRCDRKNKPPLVVIGQDQFVRCARGYMWDCRKAETCTLLDYQAPMHTNFNLRRLKQLFRDDPDQRLASNILEGIRLEADVELQVVLNPNLVSVGNGYDSVQSTVRELVSKGFYDLHRLLPFAPTYVIGQGSRIKKLGAKKYRRTSNFSAPHKDTHDKRGRKVIAVNVTRPSAT